MHNNCYKDIKNNQQHFATNLSFNYINDQIIILMKKILVSGASIAGPTLAFWLEKFNFEVTVVEKAKTLRLSGQNIDLKGAAKEVAEKMGIFEQIREKTTGEIGTRYVDKNNETVAEFKAGEIGGLTSELEILRGDLVQILYNHTKDKINYIFDDFVTEINDKGNQADVTFNSGRKESFDLVVGADGIGSKIRELAFGEEPVLDYLGLYTSYFTIPKAETDSGWARWYVAPESRNILIRPDNKGTARAALNFLSPDRHYGKRTLEEQKAVLIKAFENAGWETERILNALQDSDDLYLDAVTQVKMLSWSKGRVVLIGDAAYCPTPITGKGTALAMIGAYILAHELHHAPDHQTAFAGLEAKLRPYVEKTQHLPKSFIKLVYPSSKFGVYLLNRLESLLAGKTFQTLAGIFSSGKSDEDHFKLPEYP